MTDYTKRQESMGSRKQGGHGEPWGSDKGMSRPTGSKSSLSDRNGGKLWGMEIFAKDWLPRACECV